MYRVGYGDTYPVTVQGRFVGAIGAALGVVLLAIPASIFISGACMKDKMKKKKKKEERRKKKKKEKKKKK